MEARILIIESDQQYINNYKSYLQKISYNLLELNFTIVNSTEEAVHLIKNKTFHLVISDHNPPVTDINYLLDFLKKLDIVLPTVVFTEHGGEEFAVKSFRNGIANYFIKNNSLNWEEYTEELHQIILNLFPSEKEDTEINYKKFNWDNLSINQVYDFAFIIVRIVSNNLDALISKEEIEKIHSTIRDYIEKKISIMNGTIWNRTSDNVLGCFYSVEGSRYAVLCAIDTLIGFNLFNMSENPFPQNVGLKIAISYGQAKYLQIKTDIVSDAINHVTHIVYSDSHINQLYISDSVKINLPPSLLDYFHDYKRVDDRLTHRFYYSI